MWQGSCSSWASVSPAWLFFALAHCRSLALFTSGSRAISLLVCNCLIAPHWVHQCLMSLHANSCVPCFLKTTNLVGCFPPPGGGVTLLCARVCPLAIDLERTSFGKVQALARLLVVGGMWLQKPLIGAKLGLKVCHSSNLAAHQFYYQMEVFQPPPLPHSFHRSVTTAGLCHGS